MMAIDVKRLSEAEAIDLTRCYATSDRVMEQRRLDAELLAAASLSIEGGRQWFALRVWKRSEIELCKLLTDSHVDAVVPVKQVPLRRRWNSQARKLIHRPVLGGLVFVNIVPSMAAFAGLARVKDVAGIVGDGERPYPVGDREMNNFMNLAQKGAFDERNAPGEFKIGSKVRIPVGNNADIDAVLTGYVGARTARVEMMLFGGRMVVDVPLAQLKKLE